MKQDNSGPPEIAGTATVDFSAPMVGGASEAALDEIRRKMRAEEAELAAATEKPAKRKGGRWAKAAPATTTATAGGMAPTMEQWGMLIEALKHNTTADQEVAAMIHAQAMKKALRPENEMAPGFSVFNPSGGERPRPNGDFYLNGFPPPGQPNPLQGFPICTPNDTFTVTNTEIMLLNALQAGSFRVTKADGTETKAGVVQHRDMGGTVTATVVMIQIADDEQRNNWPPLVQLLTEITTGESPATSYARMAAKVKELEQKLAASAA